MYWKGHIQAGSVCNRLIANIDFTPTILDICGVKRPADMIVDGRSFVPLVTGESSDWRDSLLLDVGHTRGIVTQRWKYIALRYPEKVKARIASGGQSGYHMDSPLDLQLTAEKAHPAYWDGDQLYDLTADPDEKVNLAKDSAHADVLKEMQERLRAELLHLPRPFGEFRQ
jgi:arylsulfatase A-like enzyme